MTSGWNIHGPLMYRNMKRSDLEPCCCCDLICMCCDSSCLYTLQSLSYLLKTIKQKLRESRQSQTWSESYERADNHKHGVKVTREQTITNMEWKLREQTITNMEWKLREQTITNIEWTLQEQTITNMEWKLREQTITNMEWNECTSGQRDTSKDSFLVTASLLWQMIHIKQNLVLLSLGQGAPLW